MFRFSRKMAGERAVGCSAGCAGGGGNLPVRSAGDYRISLRVFPSGELKKAVPVPKRHRRSHIRIPSSHFPFETPRNKGDRRARSQLSTKKVELKLPLK